MSDIKLACDVAEQVRTICDKHGNNPGELINILHEAQHLHGYLPEEMQRIIASKLNIPVSKVYGVVTFYTFFTMTPKGKHPISVCMGTACYVRGSEKLLEEFKRVLGIEVGERITQPQLGLQAPMTAQNPMVTVAQPHSPFITLHALVFQLGPQAERQVHPSGVKPRVRSMKPQEVSAERAANPVTVLRLHPQVAPLLVVGERPGIPRKPQGHRRLAPHLYLRLQIQRSGSPVHQIRL